MKNIKTFTLMGIAAALAFGQPISSYAGTWRTGAGDNSNRWWYTNDNGTYAANGWHWIDGNNDGVSECYYFDNDGWALMNTTTPDGFTVNENGAWVESGVVKTKSDEAKVKVTKKSNSSKTKKDSGKESYDDVEEEDEIPANELAVDDPERWDYEEAEKFVELLNEYRAELGYEALELTGGDAQYYADIRSMQIVDNFSHSVDENDYIVEAEYSNEYITKNVASAEHAINAFKSSTKGHWEGLMGLEDVYEFGVGFYRMDNGLYTVSVNGNMCNEEGYRYADCIK